MFAAWFPNQIHPFAFAPSFVLHKIAIHQTHTADTHKTDNSPHTKPKQHHIHKHTPSHTTNHHLAAFHFQSLAVVVVGVVHRLPLLPFYHHPKPLAPPASSSVAYKLTRSVLLLLLLVAADKTRNACDRTRKSGATETRCCCCCAFIRFNFTVNLPAGYKSHNNNYVRHTRQKRQRYTRHTSNSVCCENVELWDFICEMCVYVY